MTERDITLPPRPEIFGVERLMYQTIDEIEAYARAAVLADRAEREKDAERLIELLESTANMMRGMTLDPAIPPHAKEALRHRVATLDAAIDAAMQKEQK